MAAQLGLPDALRRRGLTVEVVPGWETRSAGTFNPKGAVCHWTAGPAGSKTRPSLGVVTNGRPGLDGPLCNVYLDRNGVAVVVSANRANHAGAGGWRGLVGNSAVFGTEAEAAGPNDFTEAQRWAYPRVNAAYCDLGRFGPEMVCGHSEWAGARKTDINGYTMDAMRAQVAAILKGEDDMPLTDDDIKRIWQYNYRGVWTGDRLTGIDEKTGAIGATLAALVPAIVNGILDAPIDRKDLGRTPTSLRSVLAWSDSHVDGIKKAVTDAIVDGGDVDVTATVEKIVTGVSAKISGFKIQVSG